MTVVTNSPSLGRKRTFRERCQNSALSKRVRWIRMFSRWIADVNAVSYRHVGRTM
jgi:hypothetical protein